MLRLNDILLTPHQLTPDTSLLAIVDNEITSLATGIYNLGFIAVAPRIEGLRFAQWWSDRLLMFCYDDISRGLFVDQRWCDHVPSFFDRVHVIKDPGCNVASWNLSQRKVPVERDGTLAVNGNPLKFWHFTKLGPLGEVMTRRYAGNNIPVYEIWNWYRQQVKEATDNEIPDRYWAYATFADGTPISKNHRLLFRGRKDLQEAFHRPFESGVGTYQAWLKSEGML